MTGTRRPAAGDHANAVQSNDIDDIRADIVEVRSELGDTVEALAAKADVKARAMDAAETAKERIAETAETARARVTETVTTGAHAVQERAGELTARAKADPRLRRMVTQMRRRPAPIAAAAGVLLLVVGVVLRRRRNR